MGLPWRVAGLCSYQRPLIGFRIDNDERGASVKVGFQGGIQAFLALRDDGDASGEPLPFLDRPEKHEFYAILGQACQKLSEWAEAIIYYKSYLAYYGTNIQILNSMGECFYQLGDTEEALTAWERSLELEPKQEQLRKRVESIREKK